MKDQHKAMFIALRDGQLNETIDKVLGPGSVPSESKASRPPGKRRSKPPPTLPNVPAGPPVTLPAELEGATSSPVPVAKRAAPTLTDLVLADLETARARPTVANPGAGGVRPPVKGTPVLGTPVTCPAPRGACWAATHLRAPRPSSRHLRTRGSIFGGSSISEQSLDEVILSYLAEDLDGSSDE